MLSVEIIWLVTVTKWLFYTYESNTSALTLSMCIAK